MYATTYEAAIPYTIYYTALYATPVPSPIPSSIPSYQSTNGPYPYNGTLPSNSSNTIPSNYIGSMSFAGTIPAYTTPGNTNSPVPYNASYTPGNYVPGNTGTNPTNYTTGTSTNILGVTFPGGVGGVATTTPSLFIPTYKTSIPVTIPTGSYITINFSL
jgi:hypothetical protein